VRIDAMSADALTAPYLCTDATGVLVQAPEKCRYGHFWVVIAPERHVLFGYTPKHDSAAVDKQLADDRGYLVADVHIVYDHLYESGDVTEVSCWAHARRYFFKSLASDPERARVALSIIGALFKIEETIARAPPGQRKSVRATKSAPLVDKFFDWCDAEVDRVLDDTPIATAIGYACNQRPSLRRFLDDWRLPLHNIRSELELRREVLGRRNWVFVGSDEGAEVNALFVSLLASCAMHHIEPWAYMRDLFCLLPRWPRSRALELAPAHWRKTIEEPEVQQRLAANPFRATTLRPEPGPIPKQRRRQ